jgi:hypothetical protein
MADTGPSDDALSMSQVHGLAEASRDSEETARWLELAGGSDWNRWLIDAASNVCSKKLGGAR